MGLAFFLRLEVNMPLGMCGFCALLGAASLFIQLIAVIGVCYAMLAVGVYVVIDHLHTQRGDLHQIIWNLLAISVVSGLLVSVCLPHLLSTEVSSGEIEWVRHF